MTPEDESRVARAENPRTRRKRDSESFVALDIPARLEGEEVVLVMRERDRVVSVAYPNEARHMYRMGRLSGWEPTDA